MRFEERARRFERRLRQHARRRGAAVDPGDTARGRAAIQSEPKETPMAQSSAQGLEIHQLGTQLAAHERPEFSGEDGFVSGRGHGSSGNSHRHAAVATTNAIRSPASAANRM